MGPPEKESHWRQQLRRPILEPPCSAASQACPGCTVHSGRGWPPASARVELLGQRRGQAGQRPPCRVAGKRSRLQGGLTQSSFSGKRAEEAFRRRQTGQLQPKCMPSLCRVMKPGGPDGEVAEMWPTGVRKCGRNVAEMWPTTVSSCKLFTGHAQMWPTSVRKCGRNVAEMWPTCGRRFFILLRPGRCLFFWGLAGFPEPLFSCLVVKKACKDGLVCAAS